MSFTKSLWDHTAELQDAILAHPFNRELAAGTLDRDRFAFYLVQDQRYLVGFAKALATASARAGDVDDATFLAGSAQTALVVERSLHADYLSAFDISAEEADAIETAPTGLTYTAFLQATAGTADYAELVAALLPCFWVYEHVGRSILTEVGDVTDHPYATWIRTYADDDFAAAVARMRDIVDRVADGATEETRGSMRAAFVRGCELEWMFWDAAYRRETWPTRQWVTAP